MAQELYCLDLGRFSWRSIEVFKARLLFSNFTFIFGELRHSRNCIYLGQRTACRSYDEDARKNRMKLAACLDMSGAQVIEEINPTRAGRGHKKRNI